MFTVLFEWSIGKYAVDDDFFAMRLVGYFGFGLDLIFDLHGDKIVGGEVEFFDFMEEVMFMVLFVFVFDGDMHVYLNIVIVINMNLKLITISCNEKKIIFHMHQHSNLKSFFSILLTFPYSVPLFVKF